MSETVTYLLKGVRAANTASSQKNKLLSQDPVSAVDALAIHRTEFQERATVVPSRAPTQNRVSSLPPKG